MIKIVCIQFEVTCLTEAKLRADGTALVKFVDPAQLIKARDEKKALADAKAARKAANAEAERQKLLQRIEKGRVAPREMFKPPNVPENVYGSWDEKGIPLSDAEGNPLSKNAAKKIMKDYATQEKLHEEFIKWEKDH